MKPETKANLKTAQDFCDKNDKSTEFMLQYMQDFAKVDLDCVLSYLKKYGGFVEEDKPKVKHELDVLKKIVEKLCNVTGYFISGHYLREGFATEIILRKCNDKKVMVEFKHESHDNAMLQAVDYLTDQPVEQDWAAKQEEYHSR